MHRPSLFPNHFDLTYFIRMVTISRQTATTSPAMLQISSIAATSNSTGVASTSLVNVSIPITTTSLSAVSDLDVSGLGIA